jgi:hypothetical protein
VEDWLQQADGKMVREKLEDKNLRMQIWRWESENGNRI